jgi:hypothetical protein
MIVLDANKQKREHPTTEGVFRKNHLYWKGYYFSEDAEWQGEDGFFVVSGEW